MSIDAALAAMSDAGKLVVALRKRNREQDEALRGMLGLIQLVLGRDDLTRELRHVLATNHRIEAAEIAVLKTDRAPL